MKMLNKYRHLLMALILGFALGACDDLTDPVDTTDNTTDQGEKGTGQLWEEEMESLDGIPSDISIVTLEDAETPTMSDRILLTDYVPPVGDQGRYGTCTAWGCGYYARTIMYAREHNLSPSDLQNLSNVMSPKYLFLAIPPENKNPNCKGSWSGAAYEVMQNRGIANYQTVPYEDIGDCSQSINSGWDANAAQYKIDSYRKIDPTDIASLKSYVALGRPIQISCILGKNFYDIDSDAVFYDDDYSSPDGDGEHGKHAMCIVGYDNNKGATGAFRVVNSWGTDWGDAGFFWVDYNFFAETFCYAGYVIEGDKGGLSESMVDENVVNPNFQVDGKDLINIQLYDNPKPGSNSARDRRVTYNVFNKGSQTITASQDWNIIYYYYNAYNPQEDFGIIIYDYYTDDVGNAYQGQNGDFNSISTNMREYGIWNWWNYIDVPPGYSVAKAVVGDGVDYDFIFDYTMPDITGKYYLVMLADGFNAIDEQYEQNNYIFLTGENKAPLTFTNGILSQEPVVKNGRMSSHAGELKKQQPNAYQTNEIRKLVNYHLRSGKLEKKAAQLQKTRSTNHRKSTIPAVLPRTM